MPARSRGTGDPGEQGIPGNRGIPGVIIITEHSWDTKISVSLHCRHVRLLSIVLCFLTPRRNSTTTTSYSLMMPMVNMELGN